MPPTPIPPSPAFILTELFGYACTLILLRHAWRTGGWRFVLILCTAALYGFIPEYASIKAKTDYCYGQFMIMLPPWPIPYDPTDPCPAGAKVPLWIVTAWGSLIYGAIVTSNRINVPWRVRPLIDGLLVLSFDWTLDPMAAHLGFWTWYVKDPATWFGIPVGNYFGWFVTVAGFSYVLRGLSNLIPFGSRGRQGDLAVLVLTIENAFILLFVTMMLYLKASVSGTIEWILLGVTLLVALVIACVYAVRAPGKRKFDLPLVGVAIANYVYCALLMAYSGLYREQPALVAVTIGTLVFAWVGYTWPYRNAKAAGPSQAASEEWAEA